MSQSLISYFPYFPLHSLASPCGRHHPTYFAQNIEPPYNSVSLQVLKPQIWLTIFGKPSAFSPTHFSSTNTSAYLNGRGISTLGVPVGTTIHYF